MFECYVLDTCIASLQTIDHNFIHTRQAFGTLSLLKSPLLLCYPLLTHFQTAEDVLCCFGDEQCRMFSTLSVVFV